MRDELWFAIVTSLAIGYVFIGFAGFTVFLVFLYRTLMGVIHPPTRRRDRRERNLVRMMRKNGDFDD